MIVAGKADSLWTGGGEHSLPRERLTNSQHPVDDALGMRSMDGAIPSEVPAIIRNDSTTIMAYCRRKIIRDPAPD